MPRVVGLAAAPGLTEDPADVDDPEVGFVEPGGEVVDGDERHRREGRTIAGRPPGDLDQPNTSVPPPLSVSVSTLLPTA